MHLEYRLHPSFIALVPRQIKIQHSNPMRKKNSQLIFGDLFPPGVNHPKGIPTGFEPDRKPTAVAKPLVEIKSTVDIFLLFYSAVFH